MNLMKEVLSVAPFKHNSKYLTEKVNALKLNSAQGKIGISDQGVLLGDTYYYNNKLPFISEARDVLKKPNCVCKMRINWNNERFDTPTAYLSLKEQWGFSVIVVDAEHQRNKFKNKSNIWVIFDKKEDAEQNMKLFNEMFVTAMEWDCIEEYRRFKKNPDKRPLTFDQLLDKNVAYHLYDLVDKGLI